LDILPLCADSAQIASPTEVLPVRLLTRRGNGWSSRFPLILEAVNHLRVRSCLLDGEVVCCDERGVAVFHVLRRRRNEAQAFL
jgi:ATP-dependent DNA ligase